MTRHQQISADLNAAMKARDRARTSALRMLVSALQNEAVAAGHGARGELDDAEVERVVATEVKRRREAASAFREAGRQESAETEEAEAAVYEAYLPEQLSDAELGSLVDEAIAEVGAADVAQTGQVMKALMPRVQGRAPGAHVSSLVRARLGE